MSGCDSPTCSDSYVSNNNNFLVPEVFSLKSGQLRNIILLTEEDESEQCWEQCCKNVLVIVDQSGFPQKLRYFKQLSNLEKDLGERHMYYVCFQQQTKCVAPVMSQEECAWACIHDEGQLSEDQNQFLSIIREEIESLFFALKWSLGKWESNIEAANTAKVALKRKHSQVELLSSTDILPKNGDITGKGTSNLELPLTSVLNEVRPGIVNCLYKGLRKQMEGFTGKQFVIKISELAKLTLLTEGDKIQVLSFGKGQRFLITLYSMPASEKMVHRAKIVDQSEFSDANSADNSKIRSRPNEFKSHVGADVSVTIPSKGTWYHILLAQVKNGVVANSQDEVQLLMQCFGAMTLQTEVYGLLIWTTGARLYQVSKHPEDLPKRSIQVQKCEYIFNHDNPTENTSQLFALFKDIVLVMQRGYLKKDELMKNLEAECDVEGN